MTSRRLVPEQVARGVDAVDADIVQRSAAHCSAGPDVAACTCIENDELKNLGSPMLPVRTRSIAFRLAASKCSR